MEGAGVTLLLDVSPIVSLSVKVNNILLDIPLVNVIIMDEVNDVLGSFWIVVDVTKLVEVKDVLLDISLIDVTVIVEADDILFDDDKLFGIVLVVDIMPMDVSLVADVIEVAEVNGVLIDILVLVEEILDVSLVLGVTKPDEIEDFLLDVWMVVDVTEEVVAADRLLNLSLIDVIVIVEADDILSDDDKVLGVALVVGEMPLNISLVVNVTAVVGINDLLLDV